MMTGVGTPRVFSRGKRCGNSEHASWSRRRNTAAPPQEPAHADLIFLYAIALESMVCCACSLDNRKRRSIACALRDSSSRSVSPSKACARLSSLLAHSDRIRSRCWLMVGTLSWLSFSCRVIGRFLSGGEKESVVFQQRERIGHQFIQQRIAQPHGRLNRAADITVAEAGWPRNPNRRRRPFRHWRERWRPPRDRKAESNSAVPGVGAKAIGPSRPDPGDSLPRSGVEGMVREKE